MKLINQDTLIKAAEDAVRVCFNNARIEALKTEVDVIQKELYAPWTTFEPVKEALIKRVKELTDEIYKETKR